MKQKLRIALAVAALAVVITGGALAVSANLDLLRAFFKGDTTAAQDYVDGTVHTVQDENYVLTVERSTSDQNDAYLLVTIEAKNEKTRKKLFADDFNGMDTFSIAVDLAPDAVLSGEQESMGIGWSFQERPEARTEFSRSWSADVKLPMGGGPVASLRVRLCAMEEGKELVVPLEPLETMTVEIGASGAGLPTYQNPDGGEVTVYRVVFSPYTCQVEFSTSPDPSKAAEPRLFFRLADGSIRTQSQTAHVTNGSLTNGVGKWIYRFYEVHAFSDLQSVILFDREFPLDGSPSRPAAHDPALDPFRIPTEEPLSEGGGFTVPVQALTEGLGGTYESDPDTGNVTCRYRDTEIIFTPGSDRALVNGQRVELLEKPAFRRGVLAADSRVFMDAWDLDMFVLRRKDKGEIIWGDWLVVP